MRNILLARMIPNKMPNKSSLIVIILQIKYSLQVRSLQYAIFTFAKSDIVWVSHDFHVGRRGISATAKNSICLK